MDECEDCQGHGEVDCDDCDSTGVDPSGEYDSCEACGGLGSVECSECAGADQEESA